MTLKEDEMQEKRWQSRLMDATVLPSNMRDGTREVLESYGIKFLGEVEDDPMFLNVELPVGWRKEPADHRGWSKLVDDKGRERAGVFYKVPYVMLVCRFCVSHDYQRDYDTKESVTSALDCGEAVFSTDPVSFKLISKRFEIQARQRAEVEKWLDEKYPDWRNPAAYWE